MRDLPAVKWLKGNRAPKDGWNYRDVYLTHVDRDLGPGFGLTSSPFRARDVHRYLVFYSLLYDKLIVPDASTLYNEELERAIRSPRHGLADLLDEGVIVPAIRSNAPTFVELEASLRDAETWKARNPGDGRRWAEYLDRHVRSKHELGIELAEAGTRFTQLTDSALETREKAEKAGLLGVWDELKRFIESSRELADDEIVRRTTFYEFADQLVGGNRQASRSARLISSALYYRNASELLRVTPAMAMPFARMLQRMETPAALRNSVRLGERVSRRTVLQLSFGPSDLADVDAQTVLEIRQEKEFESFLREMAEARWTEEPVVAAEKAELALIGYLLFLDDFLCTSTTGRLSEFRELRRMCKLVQYAGFAGEIAIPSLAWIVGAPQENLQAAEFLWRFGIDRTNQSLGKRAANLRREGRDTVNRRREQHG
jgi:hypothetical protein